MDARAKIVGELRLPSNFYVSIVR